MDNININLRDWPDTGAEPANWPDISYTSGGQPIDQWDNYWNFNVGQAINTLEDSVNAIINRLPAGDAPLDDAWLSRTDPTIEGPLDLNGYDMIDGPRTIWNATNQYIQQSALQNDDFQINAGFGLDGGGLARLGQTVSLKVETGQFVERAGDDMTGDLGMNNNQLLGMGLAQIATDRTESHLNLGGKNPLHSFTLTSEYPFSMIDDDDQTENYNTGIAFASTIDTRDLTPGASITFDRTGSWSVGNMTFRTKEEGTRTANVKRRQTIMSDGTHEFYGNELRNWHIEQRTNRPAGPPAGRMIFRTDKDTS